MAIFLLFLLLQLSAGENGCTSSTCSDEGPTIRFPFRLKNHQPENCSYPGFDLSCNPNNETQLDLPGPTAVKLLVKNIDYKSQLIHIRDPDDCFARQLPSLNLSLSPFQFTGNLVYNFSFFSCPMKEDDGSHFKTCLRDNDREVYAVYSDLLIEYAPLLYCKKMYNISSVVSEVFDQTGDLRLRWAKPLCGNCEAEGKYCGFKNNSRGAEIECFGYLEPPIKGKWKRPLVIAGSIIGSFLLAAIVFAVYYFQRLRRIKKRDQIKIEKFLEDYRALKPARYSYADIKKITDQFKDKIGQGGYGTVYRGKLSNDVHVAVKILNNVKGNGDEFINEVGIISKIHHINVVRLVGYCADGFRRALIYEFLPKESLEKYISSDHEKGLLDWKEMQEISLGIAKGIEYLHQGCDKRILHFDIKPHNILLDHNLIPKISDFGQAKLCSKDQSVVSMTTARGTMGYIAPEIFSRNFGNVSYKSDVYSFGMLLLEMVGGRKISDATEQKLGQIYFPEWIYSRLDHGGEMGIEIKDEGDGKIARKLAIVGLWCIQWYPVDRPSMSTAIHMLEGDGENVEMPPNPFASMNQAMVSGAMGERPFNSELETIVESA